MSTSVVPVSQKSPIVTAAVLRRPTRQELQSSLEMLFAAFHEQDRSQPEKVVAVYALALQGFSAKAIREGVRKIVSGEVAEVGRWLPAAPVVARAVRAEEEQAKVRAELTWGRRVSGWRAIGHWEEAWGPEPFKPGCECPDFMLADDFKPQDSLRLLEKLA